MKPWLIPLGVFLLVALSLTFIYFRPQLIKPPVLLSPTVAGDSTYLARVLSLSGTAAKNHTTPLSAANQISEGDEISTGPTSLLSLSTTDGTLIRLDSSTRLTLVTLRPDFVLLHLSSGRVFITFSPSPNHRLDVQTSLVTVQSSGGSFAVAVSDSATVLALANQLHLVLPDQSQLTLPSSQQWSSIDPQTFSPLSDLSDPFLTISSPTPSSLAPQSPEPSEGRSGVSAITLTAAKSASAEANLTWTIDGISQNGFVVLSSTASAPTFPPRPGDQARSIADPSARTFTLTNLPTTVYLRVCELLANACGTYSNQLQLSF